jgi:hypothetical protein
MRDMESRAAHARKTVAGIAAKFEKLHMREIQ